MESDKCRLVDAAPAPAMRQVADEVDADIVVVGAISRSLLADVFIGSTTEKLLDELDCDALLLRPDNS